ncbi:MAG: hypothetical protein IJX74_06440 [Clostridia bacterium]|nr:hypothetical protein [Clostridia bacterium]
MKKALCFALIFALLSAFASCSPAPPSDCADVLAAMCKAADSLPSGRVYSTDSQSPDGVLTESLMRSLFGESALGYFYIDAEGKSAVDSCAVFIPSSQDACELAVFRCTRSNICPSVARLCLSRLDALRHGKSSPENQAALASAKVCILENYVILAVHPDPDALIREAKSIVDY